MIVTRQLVLFLVIGIVALGQAPWSDGLNHASESQGPSYHGGALLTGRGGINIYLIWYGSFSQKERTPITDFFASLAPQNASIQAATVSKWWKITNSYRDKAKNPVSNTIRLVRQVNDVKSSIGKRNIKRSQIANYIKSKINEKTLPLDLNGVYLVLTAKDVSVNKFCTGSCGFHDSAGISVGRSRIVYAHVGDSQTQCPGMCAWPYAVPAYGPPGKALVAPNGVGPDGMVMNIATVLAGAATNPFRNGYFQGNALAPLEAVTACPGIFGPGAYPGYPGKLIIDPKTKASYNTYGANGKMFLLPAMWDPIRSTCTVLNA